MRRKKYSHTALSYRFYSFLAAGIICITDYVRQNMLYYGIAGDKLEAIYPGVEIREKKNNSVFRSRLGFKEDDFIVGTTGIWRPPKMFEDFIDAAVISGKEFPDIKFVLGGKAYEADSEYGKFLKKRADDREFSGRFVFSGYVEDINDFMDSLDIFILPSLSEAFGIVLVEAMLRRIPVIAVSSGGVPEIVENEKTGLLVSQGRPEEIAAAVKRLYDDGNLRAALSEAGYEKAKNSFSAEKQVLLLEEYYRKKA